jgi:hypothetical protein
MYNLSQKNNHNFLSIGKCKMYGFRLIRNQLRKFDLHEKIVFPNCTCKKKGYLLNGNVCDRTEAHLSAKTFEATISTISGNSRPAHQ